MTPEEQSKIVKGAKDILNNPEHPWMKKTIEQWKRDHENWNKYREKLEKEYYESLSPLDRIYYDKQKNCKHENAPFVKSRYSDEKVQRGKCPDCGGILMELD